MGTYLRMTPAMRDALAALAAAPEGVWGLRVCKLTGRKSGTVYPILDRLERERIVESRWDTTSSRPGPPRRIYSLTSTGRAWVSQRLGQHAKDRGQA